MPRRPDMPPLRRERPRSRSDRPVSRLVRARRARGAAAGGDGPGDRRRARARPTRGWSCSRASARTAFASSPTTSRRRRAQLEAGRPAAMVVYWRELDRQVRIRGPVERLAGADSDAYFATRARDSQIGAWASPQSQPIESRERARPAGSPRSRRGSPAARSRGRRTGAATCCGRRTIEFWQGQVGRLHDRFRYTREGGGWRIERLGP